MESIQKYQVSFPCKKDKEMRTEIKGILAAICAMLNTRGGEVNIINTDEKNYRDHNWTSLVFRKLEQLMIRFIGSIQTVKLIQFRQEQERAIISVEKSNACLVTVNYHVYLPSQTQVVALVPSQDSPRIVKEEILYRKIIENPVEMYTHVTKFCKGERSCLEDSKVIQVKHLLSEQRNGTRLADRMTSGGNKFSCYVSAFANYKGGHIYFGIADNGVVEGQIIHEEKDKLEITQKVEEAIAKIIWPENIVEPRRGKEWEIFFEKVVDNNHESIPSTFVIVIYVAPCLGGVFIAEPECYEIQEGRVAKMSFSRWKQRILTPVFGNTDHSTISYYLPARQRWSSVVARKDFTAQDERFMKLINNAHWFQLPIKRSDAQRMLIALSKRITQRYRRGETTTATQMLHHYAKILPGAQDRSMFEIMFDYLNAGVTRASGDKAQLQFFMRKALSKVEEIEAGLVPAIVYMFAATVADLVDIVKQPDYFAIRALQHIYHVCDKSEILVDMKHKAYVTLATYNLRCNINGQSSRDDDVKPCFHGAMQCISEIYRSSCLEGRPLNSYREVQLNLIQSIYNRRYSEDISNFNEKIRYLSNALEYSRKALKVAKYCEFHEMSHWCTRNEGLCVEQLIRAKFNHMREIPRKRE